ncbi:MAG: NAD(+) diphosphatase [Pseudomarimonas sp.]
MSTKKAPNLFAGSSLDRAAERRDDPAWLAAAWPSASLLLVDFEGRAALDPSTTAFANLRASEFPAALVSQASFLGVQGDRPYFALAAEALDADRRSGPWTWTGLREAAGQLSAFEAGLFAYAKALLLWQTRARFCPACGTATQLRRAGHSTRCGNADCGLEQFPRTDAAIIVLVTDGPRALIGRQAGWPRKRYSTLAGFVEPGESLEDALRREVFEESGVRVGECQYQSSQPWPFPASLMLGFRAQAVNPTITLGDELEDVRWISANDLLDEVERGNLRMPFPISVSFRLLADWLLESADPDRVRTLLPGA